MSVINQFIITTFIEYSHHILPAFLKSYFLYGVKTLLDFNDPDCRGKEEGIVKKFVADNNLGECIDVIPNREISMESHELPELISDCIIATFIFKTLA